MSFASNTPIHFLPGVGSRTAAVLHQLGVHTVGQLLRIPDQILIELFGPSIRAVTSIVTTHQRQNHSPTMQSTHHYARQESRAGHRKKPLLKKLHLAINLLTML